MIAVILQVILNSVKSPEESGGSVVRPGANQRATTLLTNMRQV
jgi:hypothetical protein